MAYFHFDNIKVGGFAAAVPKNVVKTESFYDLFGKEEVDKFMEMTGVRESRRTSPHQTAGDLGFTAAKALLEHKNIDPKEIGAVIFASHSPDYRRPATAFIIQHRLKVPVDAVAYDISLGCSSLVYGVQTIAALMNASDIEKAILIVGDTAGKSVYPNDRSSAMLFGEAGAAMLLEKTSGPDNQMRALLKSDGSGYKYMIIPGGGYRYLNPPETVFDCTDGNPRTLYNSYIQGTSVFTFTIFDVPKILREFFEKTQTKVEDYDVFAFHQANLYILKQIAKKIKIPLEKMPFSLQKYGNTSGASPLISLIEQYTGVKDQTLNTLFCGFGIGLSWGVFSAEIATNDIVPIIEDDSFFEEGVIHSPNQLYKGL